MKYILELESLVIVCASGDIYKYSFTEKTCDNVGCIENGILAASWSPN